MLDLLIVVATFLIRCRPQASSFSQKHLSVVDVNTSHVVRENMVLEYVLPAV